MDSICQSRNAEDEKEIPPIQTGSTDEESGSKVENKYEESQSKEEEKMKQGKHQLRWQFNSEAHDPERPVQFNLDNGDYTRNFVIESFEIIWASMDKGTNNTDISNNTHQIVLALTEEGAMPINTETVNSRPFAMRVADRRQVAWGQMDNNIVNTILDPHNIVGEDLWLNAWAFGSAHTPAEIDQDIGVLITLTEVKQSGNRALLGTVRDAPLD